MPAVALRKLARFVPFFFAALITAITAAVFQFGFLTSWQEKITDRFFVRKSAPRDIIIVAIDNRSLAAIGQWPWPRSVFGALVGKLAPARVIGIDVNFSEPSRLGRSDDALLTAALERASNPVVLPLEANEKTLQVVSPLPDFASATRQGFVDLALDHDGVLRFARQRIGEWKSFGLTIFEHSGGGKAVVPDALRIDYRGPAKTFTTISFSDVLEGKIPNRLLEDATVLVGATAEDLHDTVQTPFGPLPGVEAHANIIATLRSGTVYQPLPAAFILFLAALLNSVCAAAIVRVRRILPLAVILGVLFLVIQLGAFLAFEFAWLVPNLALSAGFLGTAGAVTLFQYLTESREKRFIRKTFQYYLAPDVIAELLRDPEKVALGGERKSVTIFFSDIRGFTSLSEKMNPDELVRIVNEYLTAMTGIILEKHGLVDKYIGDAIMALWGAPLAYPGAAEAACRAALGMLAKLAELNERWAAAGLPRLDIGIGINTGEVFVGNVGSKERFNYTVIGDEVNFASRLEGLNKVYGTRIILSEATRRAVAGVPDLFVRELDRVMVKGKREPRTIFELLPGGAAGKALEALECFARGRKHYEGGRWDEAAAEFQRAIELADDPPSRVFLERCRELKKHPPEEWTGVYEFTQK